MRDSYEGLLGRETKSFTQHSPPKATDTGKLFREANSLPGTIQATLLFSGCPKATSTADTMGQGLISVPEAGGGKR